MGLVDRMTVVNGRTPSFLSVALVFMPLIFGEQQDPYEWEDLSWLKNCSDDDFRSLSRIIANATFLSYVSTHGSYYDPEYDNATVNGWKRRYEHSRDPANGGMHALFFSNRNYGLLALRGTDLGTSVTSHLADSCADKLLWNNQTYDQLPVYCKVFTAHTLDYYSRAVDLLHEVCRSNPNMSLMLTGHSLGAGLSILLSALSTPPGCTFLRAVAFSAPGVQIALERRQGVGEVDPKTAFVLADTYDPVFVSSVCPRDLSSNSSVCLWESQLTRDCATCYDRLPPVQYADPFCLSCVSQRHIYAHYFKDLVPRGRPRCSGPIPDWIYDKCPGVFVS
ncbi:hypothetical protein AAMO2058_000365500 [Amorphochlora amoebiformis]